MALIPKQVEDDAKEAEDLLAQMNNADEGDDSSSEEQDVTDEEEDDDADTSGTEAGDSDDDEDPDDSADDVDTDDEESTYRDRYNTLKGKYDGEVPRLQRDLRDLKDKVFANLGENADGKTEEPSKEDTLAEVRSRIEQAREEYDPDMIALIEDIFQLNVADALKTNIQPVVDKVDKLENDQTIDARSTVENTIDSQVEGDWRKLMAGEDSGFLEFLAESEPNGMFTYGDVLDKANKQWDGNRMAKLFKLYLDEGNQDEATTDEDAVVETKPATEKKKKKKARVAPSRTQTSATPVDEDKIVWTQAAIAQFDKDERSGKYKNEPEKLEELWNDLLTAPKEGRVRD